MMNKTKLSVAGPMVFGVERSSRCAGLRRGFLRGALRGAVVVSLVVMAGCNLGEANFVGTKTMKVMPPGGGATGDGFSAEATVEATAGESKTLSRADLMPGVNAGVFDISSGNGAITVEPSTDGVLSVMAEIKATTQERLDACVLSVVPGSGGGLTIRVVWPDGVAYMQEGASITVKAPVRSGLTLETSNGAIAATAVTGTVKARTSNGRIMIQNVGGDVSVRTSNGAVTIGGAVAAVAAKTSNGAVVVTMGDNAIGPCNITTSNGAVKLSIGPGMSGSATISTGNGGITLSGRAFEKQTVNKSSASIEFGAAGGPASSIRTSNGGIEVILR